MSGPVDSEPVRRALHCAAREALRRTPQFRRAHELEVDRGWLDVESECVAYPLTLALEDALARVVSPDYYPTVRSAPRRTRR